MMSRGIVLPAGSLRLPVSMTWVASVFTSMISPALTGLGILMRGGFCMS